MTLKQLIKSKQSLENLLKGSLPIGIAWELKKFVESINPELSSYEQARNAKIIELGEKSAEGGVEITRVKPDFMKQFNDFTEESLNKEIDIKIPKINIKDLAEYKDANGNKISVLVGDLMILDWLICEN